MSADVIVIDDQIVHTRFLMRGRMEPTINEA
jgi:hypothetical protein